MIDKELPKNEIQAMVVIVGGVFPYLNNSYQTNSHGKINLDDDLDLKYTG